MLSSAQVAKTVRDLALFSAEWNLETPGRIHQHALGADGRPAMTAEFSSWLFAEAGRWQGQDASLSTLRLTRAMKSLRKVAPREYDVMRRAFNGESARQICGWLNDRAIAGGHPERYSIKDTVVLLVSGCDKLAAWF